MIKRKIITGCFILLTAAMITGCTDGKNNGNANSSAEISSVQIEEKVQLSSDESIPEKSQTSEKSENSIVTEYEKMETFEYTEEMLANMNKDDPDFEIIHDKDGTTISGHINTSRVKSEQDAIEQIKLVRSVLGLVNPEQQLVFDEKNSGGKKYRFEQFYGGYRINSMDVTVETDNDGLIVYTTANVLPVETLKKIKLDNLLSEEEVLKKNPDYKNAEIRAAEIWPHNEYSDTPIVVYEAYTDFSAVLFSAADGSVADTWTTIVD